MAQVVTHIPTDFEQAMLEYINRARLSPGGEFDRVIADAGAATGVQSNITSALQYYGVSIEAFRTQMAAFDPVAPLAWNGALATAADTHGQLMIDADSQSHRLPGEAGLGERIEAAGYTDWSRVGENIYTYTEDPLHGHASFMVDWGYDDADFSAGQLVDDWQSRGDGIQDAAGHRSAIMSAGYVDIGISALAETDGATRVGPWVVTQNFGAIYVSNPALLLGVFLDDGDGDRFYDIGEGLGGITVTATGSAGEFSTTTWESGGYQMELPAGSYSVQFSGGVLDGVAQYDVIIGSENVKLDGFVADAGGEGEVTFFGDGLEAVYFPDIAAQVYRLYQATLGRIPDAEGHLAWTVRLAVGGWDIDDVVQSFVNSPEFQARFGGLDNEEFVTLLYNNVLNRMPDAMGRARWVGDLDDGVSRAEVVRGFSDSPEFGANMATAAKAFAQGHAQQTWSDDVFRLYQATLDRAPDLAGFSNWTGRLAEGTPYLEVVEGFVNSREFQNAYGSLSNGDFVAQLYRNVLDREGDATGLANWTARLDAGMSRAQVVQGFAQSGEFVADTAADVTTWIRAQGIDDQITGDGGDNMLAGGFRTDSFVFSEASGADTVLDLEPWDIIDLRAFDYATDGAARDGFSQQGTSVVFDDGGASEVTFLNADLAMLTDEMILT